MVWYRELLFQDDYKEIISDDNIKVLDDDRISVEKTLFEDLAIYKVQVDKENQRDFSVYLYLFNPRLIM